MSSFNRLLKLISTPELVKGVWAMVKGKYPDFPTNACAATLSTFLSEAGYPQSFGTWAQSEADEAEREGWTRIPATHPPMPCDIFVCGDLNENGATDHVGLVYMAGTAPMSFWAIDNRVDQCVGGKPYLRNAGPGKFTPVSYFLRPPSYTFPSASAE